MSEKRHPLKQRDEPNEYASGYSIDLYCKWVNPHVPYHDFAGAHTFTGETFGEAAREARANGWIIHRDRTATCPFCARWAKARPDTDSERGQTDE